MADGEGCRCFASCYGECMCEGVDWRSSREVELEAENAKLRGEVERLAKERDDWIVCHARVWKRLQRAHKAIEAMRVAGGSEEFQVAFDAAKGLVLCSELIGEPTRGVLANPEETSDCHGPDWTERDGEYLK